MEPDDEQLVRLLLLEQRHTLAAKDIQLLESKQVLRSDSGSQSNNGTASPDEPLIDFSSSKFQVEVISQDESAAEADSPANTDNTISDFGAILEDFTDNSELSTYDFNDLLVSCMNDDNNRSRISELNKYIRENKAASLAYIKDAQITLAEIRSYKRQLVTIGERICAYSSEDAKLRKIQKKKGKDCANTGSHHRTYFCRFGIPYFKSKERFPADQNEDIKEIVRKNEVMLIRIPQARKFLSNDGVMLDRCILKQLKNKRIQDLQSRLHRLVPTKEGNDHFYQQKRNLIVAIENARNVKCISETQDWNTPVDFSVLSEVNARFTAEDFERMWHLVGNSKWSRKDFTSEEIAKLKEIAEEHRNQDWDQIAEELGTNRSGFSCFIKWVGVCKKGKHVPWTAEEDDLLRTLCTKLKDIENSGNTYLWWRNIRRKFPHRTYAQVHAHWFYVLKPSLKKGRFTPEENTKLTKLVEEGKTYREIADIFKNRSSIQLRTHYKSTVDGGAKGQWTEEEENRLMELVIEHGSNNWVKISKELGTRNRSQCRLKYLLLEKLKHWSKKEKSLFVDLILKYGNDFERISQEMGTRTVRECMEQYGKRGFVGLTRKGNFKKGNIWTCSEKIMFMKLFEKHGCDFEKISKAMGNRSIAQCKAYYNVIHNQEPNMPYTVKLNREDIKRMKLEKYEDAIQQVIHQSCEERDEQEETFTETVKSMEKGKKNVRFRWKPDEKKQLKNLVLECDGNFEEVSFRLRNKTPGQCKRMYEMLVERNKRNYTINPSLIDRKKRTAKGNRWTRKEYIRFKELLNVYGTDFLKISQALGTKSISQCQRRYEFLEKSKQEPVASPKKSFSEDTRSRTDETNQLDHLIDIRENDFLNTVKSSETITGENFPEGIKTSDKFENNDEEMADVSNQLSENRWNVENLTETSENVKKASRWTKKEATLFKRLLDDYHCNLEYISKALGTKTVQQCQKRYMFLKKSFNYENPQAAGNERPKHKTWTVTEKIRLLELIDNCNMNFTEASTQLATKTVRQCQSMYHVIKKNSLNDSENDLNNHRCSKNKNSRVLRKVEEIEENQKLKISAAPGLRKK